MSRSPSALAALVLVLAVVPAVGGTSLAHAQAQAGAPDEADLSLRAHEFAHSVMSPFCKGRALSDCPSPDAALLREKIKGWLRMGMTEEQIQEYLVRTWGPVVIAVPRGSFEWAMPTGLLIAGLGLAAYAVRRATRRPITPVTQISIPKDLEKRLDAELRSHGF